MVDFNMFQSWSDPFWEDPIGWYVNLPLFGQIIIIIALIALTIAVLVLVYYILKGLAYLLYYIFKGLYYLFKGIFLGFYKLFEAVYYAISGKNKKKNQPIIQTPKSPPVSYEYTTNLIMNLPKVPYYCTECGNKLTKSMQSLLTSQKVAYCFHCGKEFELKGA